MVSIIPTFQQLVLGLVDMALCIFWTLISWIAIYPLDNNITCPLKTGSWSHPAWKTTVISSRMGHQAYVQHAITCYSLSCSTAVPTLCLNLLNHSKCNLIDPDPGPTAMTSITTYNWTLQTAKCPWLWLLLIYTTPFKLIQISTALC